MNLRMMLFCSLWIIFLIQSSQQTVNDGEIVKKKKVDDGQSSGNAENNKVENYVKNVERNLESLEVYQRMSNKAKSILKEKFGPFEVQNAPIFEINNNIPILEKMYTTVRNCLYSIGLSIPIYPIADDNKYIIFDSIVMEAVLLQFQTVLDFQMTNDQINSISKQADELLLRSLSTFLHYQENVRKVLNFIYESDGYFQFSEKPEQPVIQFGYHHRVGFLLARSIQEEIIKTEEKIFEYRKGIPKLTPRSVTTRGAHDAQAYDAPIKAFLQAKSERSKEELKCLLLIRGYLFGFPTYYTTLEDAEPNVKECLNTGKFGVISKRKQRDMEEEVHVSKKKQINV